MLKRRFFSIILLNKFNPRYLTKHLLKIGTGAHNNCVVKIHLFFYYNQMLV